MAELINLVTWTGINVTPMDDALIYDSAVGGSGLFYGGEISIKDSNTLHIAAGHGIVCGRKFTIVEGDIPVELAASGTLKGRVYIHLDLSNTSEPIEILTETAVALTPEIQENDVNIFSGVYEFNLATFNVSTSAISGVHNIAPSVALGRSNDLISDAEVNPALNAHAVGDYLIFNNTLYKVIQPISEGNTLVVDGNIKETRVGDEITSVNAALAKPLGAAFASSTIRATTIFGGSAQVDISNQLNTWFGGCPQGVHFIAVLGKPNESFSSDLIMGMLIIIGISSDMNADINTRIAYGIAAYISYYPTTSGGTVLTTYRCENRSWQKR